MGLCTGRFGGEPREVEKKAGVMSRLVTSSSNLDYGHHTDDDELLNLCTAKFTTQTSQENSSSAAADMEKPGNQLEDVESRPVPDMIVYSSDEENDMHRQAKLKIRKKRRRIMQFSDDEDAQDAIEYDDEENEIRRTTFSGFKDKMKGGIRADFLENEAELSGSDLNSDDEEDGEDVMEMEEGDYEHFDENDLRNQVGRAHLKNVLDSDKRELRLLQEMYLEDGELHGEGRQRQFRWKNMGDDEEGNERKAMSDEEGVEEEGEDVDWRKQRIEREKFLKEQKTKVEDNEAQVFKLGRRSIVRSTSLIVDPASKREPLQEVNRPPAKIPQITKNLPPLLPKRGSFLARDKVTLARIAELTKARGAVVGGAKQAGNFVFQQLSAEEVQKKVESTKVMKAHGLPASKRPRVDRSFSSMDITSQSSSIFKYL
ncbi:claspin-like [Homarus americanus]|uniref:claspin-like n=1 Tax=Homarus americanus TaxID=6706 RepID=UPI001C46FE98|nr:claspin-like [Homarus americanus]